MNKLTLLKIQKLKIKSKNLFKVRFEKSETKKEKGKLSPLLNVKKHL